MKKGQKHSKETKEKMRRSAANRRMPPMTEEHKRKLRDSNKKTWSDQEKRDTHSLKTKEALAKMSPEKKAQQITKNSKSWTKERREMASQLMKELRASEGWLEKSNEAKRGKPGSWLGKKHTVETRLKISKTKKDSPFTPRGEDNPAYIDGKGEERRGERLAFANSLEYKLFRQSVLERDGHKCVLCECENNLHVDHIKSYHKHPELRTNLDNGRTLCAPCHRSTKNYGRKN